MTADSLVDRDQFRIVHPVERERMDSRLDLSIIIVNWNTRDLLRACLASLPAACSELRFLEIVGEHCTRKPVPGPWQLDPDLEA